VIETMSSELQKVLELLAGQAETKTLPIAERRRIDDETAENFPLPDDMIVEAVETGKIKGEWVKFPVMDQDAALLYMHGGGYVFCSPRSHRHLAAALSKAARVPVLSLDYRLAPEHVFPAALEDSVNAFRWLMEQGIAPDRIVVAGDSAGGGLALAMMLSLRDQGSRLPAAGVCLSPWVDLTMAGSSYTANDEALATRDRLNGYAELYLKGTSAKHPLASPVFADLQGLPTLLIQVGSAEPFFDDSVSLEAAAKASGVEVELEVWKDMIHVWHYFHPLLSEGRQAIARIGEFVHSKISAA